MDEMTTLDTTVVERPDQDMTPARSETRYRRIAAAAGSAVLGKGANLLVSAIAVPLTVRYLGSEGYGLWITISSAATMFLVMDIGIANTLTNLVSEAYAKNDKHRAAVYFATAFWVVMGISLLLGVGAWAAWPHFQWAEIFHVQDPRLADVTSRSVAVALAVFLVALPAGLAARVLGGYQELHTANLFAAVGNLMSLAGVVTVIRLHGTLPWLLGAFAGAPVAANAVCLAWICLFHKPWMRPSPARVQPQLIGDIFQTGGQFFLIQIAGLVVFNTDSLIISHYLSPAKVAPYNVTWRMVSYITAVPVLVMPSLWPAYAEANARGDLAWIRAAYSRTRRLTLAVLSVGCAVLLLGGKTLIRLWAGPSMVPDLTLLSLMCVWMFIFAITLNQSCLMGATNRTKRQSVFGTASSVANLALSLLWVRPLGPAGVLLATIVSYLAFVVVIQTIEVRKILRGDFLANLGKTVETSA